MHAYRVMFGKKNQYQWGYIGFHGNGKLKFTDDINQAWLTHNEKRREEIRRRLYAYDHIFMLDKATIMPLVIDNDPKLDRDWMFSSRYHTIRREKYGHHWWVVQSTLDNGHKCYLQYNSKKSELVSFLEHASWYRKYGKAATRLGMGRSRIEFDYQHELEDRFGVERKNYLRVNVHEQIHVQYPVSFQEQLVRIHHWDYQLLPIMLSVINFENGVVYNANNTTPQ